MLKGFFGRARWGFRNTSHNSKPSVEAFPIKARDDPLGVALADASAFCRITSI